MQMSEVIKHLFELFDKALYERFVKKINMIYHFRCLGLECS